MRRVEGDQLAPSVPRHHLDRRPLFDAAPDRIDGLCRRGLRCEVDRVGRRAPCRRDVDLHQRLLERCQDCVVRTRVGTLPRRRRAALRAAAQRAPITKSLVATVALQLVGEGTLSLSDPVERWLPVILPDRDPSRRVCATRPSLVNPSAIAGSPATGYTLPRRKLRDANVLTPPSGS